MIGCLVTYVVVQVLGFLIGLFWLPVSYENHVIFPIPISLANVWAITTIATCMIYGAVFAAVYRPVEG